MWYQAKSSSLQNLVTRKYEQIFVDGEACWNRNVTTLRAGHSAALRGGKHALSNPITYLFHISAADWFYSSCIEYFQLSVKA